jgi:iron complex outermembrane recepter protein
MPADGLNAAPVTWMAPLNFCCRIKAGIIFVAAALLVASDALPPVCAQNPPTSDSPPSSEKSLLEPAKAEKLDALLNLAEKDVGRLSEVPIAAAGAESTSSGPSNTLNAERTDTTGVTSTGDLLKMIPNVYGRRLSGINIDPRVRGFNSSQLNANANGMTQYKAIQDIDSLLSQIDPGVIQNVEVIEGPYTSLYGPGFAFINVDLVGAKRYERPEIHTSTAYNYTSNGQIMYGRENVWGGSKDWGMFCTYGVRTGNDYRAGGKDSDWLVPTSFEKWDTMLSVSYDINSYSRIEFDMLHTDMNNVEMPGIVYDLDNSANNQFNVRYIVQEDRDGPRQLLVQSWHQDTLFHGDASHLSKQISFYQAFIADTAVEEGYSRPVNTLSSGYSVSTGVRLLRTFGEADDPQWTFGADWRRFSQRYTEQEFDAGGVPIYDGYMYGIPECRTDDIGVLTDLRLRAGDHVSLAAGGRVDYTQSWLNADDQIVTQCSSGQGDPYYPGTNKPNYTLGMAYLAAKWEMNEHDTLNVGNGLAMRSANLGELYSMQPFVPIARLGNSFVDAYSWLKPEKNWQFDLGITSQRGPFRYGGRGFYATIWDYITTAPFYICAPADSTHDLGRNFWGYDPALREDIGKLSVNGDTCQTELSMYNAGLATMAGGDLFGEVEIRKGMTVFGCMSYVHGENLRPMHVIEVAPDTYALVPLGGTQPLPGIYPFNGRLSLRVFDPDKDIWGVELVARFVHSQTEVAASLPELPSAGFSVYDLKGYYRVRENIRVSLSLENLLNRDYYEPGSVVILNPAGIPTFIREPGFSAILGVDGKF